MKLAKVKIQGVLAYTSSISTIPECGGRRLPVHRCKRRGSRYFSR